MELFKDHKGKDPQVSLDVWLFKETREGKDEELSKTMVHYDLQSTFEQAGFPLGLRDPK
jgi:hypothetical protein